LGGGLCTRGWALAEQGLVEAGITSLCQGLAAWQEMGTELGQTHNLAMLAEAYGKGGQTEAGLHVLKDALTMMHRNAERHYAAELYRLQGELLWQRAAVSHGPLTEAEACLRQALDVARQQSAKSLELRAALSLSRLWQQQGEPSRARRLLAEVYDWFTEGFDTPDLQAARTLLEAL